jgi:hypothetical protein
MHKCKKEISFQAVFLAEKTVKRNLPVNSTCFRMAAKNLVVLRFTPVDRVKDVRGTANPANAKGYRPVNEF